MLFVTRRRLRSVAVLVSVTSLGLAGLGGVAAAADGDEGARAIASDTAFTAVAGSVGTPPQPVRGSDGRPTGELPYEAAADPGPRRREMPLDRDIITFGG